MNEHVHTILTQAIALQQHSHEREQRLLAVVDRLSSCMSDMLQLQATQQHVAHPHIRQALHGATEAMAGFRREVHTTQTELHQALQGSEDYIRSHLPMLQLLTQHAGNEALQESLARFLHYNPSSFANESASVPTASAANAMETAFLPRNPEPVAEQAAAAASAPAAAPALRGQQRARPVPSKLKEAKRFMGQKNGGKPSSAPPSSPSSPSEEGLMQYANIEVVLDASKGDIAGERPGGAHWTLGGGADEAAGGANEEIDMGDPSEANAGASDNDDGDEPEEEGSEEGEDEAQVTVAA